MKEARLPMGLRKDLHIKKITEIPEVSRRWKEKHGRRPTEEDLVKMYNEFIPIQLSCLEEHSTLIPGALETITKLRKDYGLKIGTTTGFTEEMVDVVLEKVSLEGYEPDSSVAGDSVINGTRPNPHMLYKNMDNLNISSINSILKVDDTISGIEEGLEAGCWTVGVSKYSNYMNIDDFDHEKNLSKKELNNKHNISKEILLKSGAHYVVDDITKLPEVVDHINSRLSLGERP
jgi:phosphonoacetaldehyde hydrolase